MVDTQAPELPTVTDEDIARIVAEGSTGRDVAVVALAQHAEFMAQTLSTIHYVVTTAQNERAGDDADEVSIDTDSDVTLDDFDAFLELVHGLVDAMTDVIAVSTELTEQVATRVDDYAAARANITGGQYL